MRNMILTILIAIIVSIIFGLTIEFTREDAERPQKHFITKNIPVNAYNTAKTIKEHRTKITNISHNLNDNFTKVKSFIVKPLVEGKDDGLRNDIVINLGIESQSIIDLDWYYKTRRANGMRVDEICVDITDEINTLGFKGSVNQTNCEGGEGKSASIAYDSIEALKTSQTVDNSPITIHYNYEISKYGKLNTTASITFELPYHPLSRNVKIYRDILTLELKQYGFQDREVPMKILNI